jgi:cellulose synthase/poly-beta-1,6-N-acetylglucosamine synthase-like glycosyltransferase
MPEGPAVWPPRETAREAFPFAARFLAGLYLTCLGALMSFALLVATWAAVVVGDPGFRSSFEFTGMVVAVTGRGLAVGSLSVSWLLAIAVYMPLAAFSMFGVIQLARGIAGPALIVVATWLVISAIVTPLGGLPLRACSRLPRPGQVAD